VHWSSTLKLKLAQKPAIWVTVLQAQGSVPRGAGTVMAVFADDFLGTIGGGHLEFEDNKPCGTLFRFTLPTASEI
jgi:xanthine dehydrogenase accessory factor